MVGARTLIAAQQLASVLANATELDVIVILFLFSLALWRSVLVAVRATPLAFRRLVQLGIETDQVVSLRTEVTENDFAALLAHLAVVLVIRLLENGKALKYSTF